MQKIYSLTLCILASSCLHAMQIIDSTFTQIGRQHAQEILDIRGKEDKHPVGWYALAKDGLQKSLGGIRTRAIAGSLYDKLQSDKELLIQYGILQSMYGISSEKDIQYAREKLIERLMFNHFSKINKFYIVNEYAKHNKTITLFKKALRIKRTQLILETILWQESQQ